MTSFGPFVEHKVYDIESKVEQSLFEYYVRINLLLKIGEHNHIT
jgi:hypothetical protein